MNTNERNARVFKVLERLPYDLNDTREILTAMLTREEWTAEQYTFLNKAENLFSTIPHLQTLQVNGENADVVFVTDAAKG